MDLNYIPLIFLITKLNLERHCLLICFKTDGRAIRCIFMKRFVQGDRTIAKCITDNMATLIF